MLMQLLVLPLQVMVDVWTVTDPVLLDNMHARLLPLLAAARQLGFFIVHAPSSAPLWPNITVLPGEVLVTGEDGHPGSTSRCDGVLRDARGGRIAHVLLVGYDTNLCVLDKPCGAVSLSTELLGSAELLLVRDATRPGPDAYDNGWFTWVMNVNLVESGAWLPQSNATGGGGRHIRSLVLPDLFTAFGMNAAALPTPSSPVFSIAQGYPGLRPSEIVAADLASGIAALVVVSATDVWDNAGFGARVAEHMHDTLVPLLAYARAAGIRVIHVPNNHTIAPACQPRPAEFVIDTDEAFQTVLTQYHITSLAYVGYAANRDVMWGVGGLAKYYSHKRYLGATPPTVAWVPEATLALETAESIEAWRFKFQIYFFTSFERFVDAF